VLTNEQLQEIAKMGKTMYVHSTFNTIPGKYYSKEFFISQYKLCSANGIKGLVIHIPNIPIDEVVAGFKMYRTADTQDKKVIIFLEHVPGEYGASAELLCTLYAKLVAAYPKFRFGLCIDTCHVYSSGVNLGDTPHMVNYLETISATKAPILIHLNDSYGELGSLIDRHAPLGEKIWTENNYSTLQYLLTKPWDAVLEMSPEAVEKSLKFIKSME
jgi:endonuclease IV